MKNLKLLIVNIMLFLSLLICSCKNSVSNILDDYNSKFTPIYADDEAVLDTDDAGFSESMMLLDKYIVSQYATLNLTAPQNCGSYEWEIQDPESGTLDDVSVRTMSGSTDRTQRFVLFIPDSGLYGAKTYRLCLTVITHDSRSYKDYATLAVYNDYYFETGIVTIPPGTSSRSINVVSEDVSSDYESNECYTARSILPSAYNIDDSDLHYYLYAKNLLTNEVISPFEVEITKDTNDESNKSGEFSFNIKKGNYFFTLMAVNYEPSDPTLDTLAASCSYIAFASADNRYNDSVSFVLAPSTDALCGKAQLKVYTNNWDFSDSIYDGYTVKSYLTNTENETVTPLTLIQSLGNDNLVSNTVPSSPNYSILIAPGTYRFNVSFTKGANVYEWSDLLTVVAGVTTEQDFAIPKIIPVGYTDFKIYTNGWNYSDNAYSGFSMSLNVTDKNGSTADYSLTSSFSGTLENICPTSSNFGISADLGKYILDVKFTEGSKSYTYKYPFTVEAGEKKTETVGITSSTISTGTVNFKLYTDGWDITDSDYDGYTTSLSITDISGNASNYSITTQFSGTLPDSEPGEANFGIFAASGTYILNVSFIKGDKTYIHGYQFVVQADKLKTETDGISSSVIPLESSGGG